jgi:hypothetical protein
MKVTGSFETSGSTYLGKQSHNPKKPEFYIQVVMVISVIMPVFWDVSDVTLCSLVHRHLPAKLHIVTSCHTAVLRSDIYSSYCSVDKPSKPTSKLLLCVNLSLNWACEEMPVCDRMFRELCMSVSCCGCDIPVRRYALSE